MQNLATLLVLTAACGFAQGQSNSPAHAPTGEFKQPTPSERFRQLASRNNLVHPAGYVTAELGTFGDVVERGTGATPVILLTGLGPGHAIWESFIAAHASEARFFAVTLAGYGGSSAPPMPAAGTSFGERSWLAASERALGTLIDERKLERPLLVTFYSDATNIGMRFALAHPGVLSGVLALSSSARFPLPAGAARAAGMDDFAQTWFKTVTEVMWPSGMWAPDFYSSQADLSEKIWWDVLQPSLPSAIRYMVEAWADDLIADIAPLETPTIALSPGFDEEFLSRTQGGVLVERFHAGWQDAAEASEMVEHRVVPDARLLIWEDQPDAVAVAFEQLIELRNAE